VQQALVASSHLYAADHYRGDSRVVLAWREPTIFVDCEGVELLRAANIDVVEIAELADEVKQINAHLLGTN
jgi:pyrimidine deaminase RibD-like protein